MEIHPIGEWIYETPDQGDTVYRRKSGTNEKELVCSPDPDLFSYYEFKDIIILSKDNASIRKALDNLRLLYYTVKDGK
jgi:hypothetical protein